MILLTSDLEVLPLDFPGLDGAFRDYLIRSVGVNPSWKCRLIFQHGPIDQVGVNGITDDALLAIIEHRLTAVPNGMDRRNAANVLLKVQEARMWLNK